MTTWSGIHGLAQLISGGYLSRLAATERQVETLGKMVCELLLTGILKPDEKNDHPSANMASIRSRLSTSI